MAQVQDYAYSGPFSACRGECGRAVIAAVNELCEFCRGLKAELEHKPAEQPEPAAPEADTTPGPAVEHVLHESEPETQPAYR